MSLMCVCVLLCAARRGWGFDSEQGVFSPSLSPARLCWCAASSCRRSVRVRRGLRGDYRPRRVINLCRGLSIDCSPSVSQSLAIKDVTGQFGVAGGARSDFNRFHAEVRVCRQAGKLSSFHGVDPQAGEEGGDAQVAGRRGDVENEESRMLRCCGARSTGKPPFLIQSGLFRLRLIPFPVSSFGTVFLDFVGHY